MATAVIPTTSWRVTGSDSRTTPRVTPRRGEKYPVRDARAAVVMRQAHMKAAKEMVVGTTPIYTISHSPVASMVRYPWYPLKGIDTRERITAEASYWQTIRGAFRCRTA